MFGEFSYKIYFGRRDTRRTIAVPYTDEWTTTAVQDEGGWRRTAEQGAEHFMAKWIAAEEARVGLRHLVVCLNLTKRTKERIAQSKRTRAGLLAIVE